MPEPTEPPEPTGLAGRDAERLKFFTDAVVAIAMTLLILPLLESVAEAAREGVDTADFLSEHSDQLFAFTLSFVIIAVFWVVHERLFVHVGRWTTTVLVLHVAWMLSIVFLPVATAMVGSMETDRPQVLVYVGTMLATSLLVCAINVVVRRAPATWATPHGPTVDSLIGQGVSAGLFAVAMVAALTFGGGYLWLLVLVLSGPIGQLIARRRASGR